MMTTMMKMMMKMNLCWFVVVVLISSVATGCDVTSCPGLNCSYGYQTDENNCMICLCNSYPMCPEPMCDIPPCEFGLRQNSEGCHDCECNPAQPACPDMTCSECPMGNSIGPDGCKTCACSNPCFDSSCGVDEKCVADASNPQGYLCKSVLANLCCQKPSAPLSILFARNACTNCVKDCSTMKCQAGYQCCVNWYGCYSCKKSMKC